MTTDITPPANPESDTLESVDHSPPRPLRESAERSIQHFLTQLDGQPAADLYDMVMAQVEEPLLAAVMAFTHGNQSKASEMLGLNRGTLRKKLRQYGLLETTNTRSAT